MLFVLTFRTCFGFNDLQILHIHKKWRWPFLYQLFTEALHVSTLVEPNQTELGFVITNDKPSYVAKEYSICLFSVAWEAALNEQPIKPCVPLPKEGPSINQTFPWGRAPQESLISLGVVLQTHLSFTNCQTPDFLRDFPVLQKKSNFFFLVIGRLVGRLFTLWTQRFARLPLNWIICLFFNPSLNWFFFARMASLRTKKIPYW